MTRRESDDERIVERLLARDEAALRDVMAEHSAYVYGTARRVIADPSLAEEVAQDAFLALWRRPGAFDPARGNLRTFLCGVARNKAIDLVRRSESMRNKDQLLVEDPVTSGKPDAFEHTEDRELLNQALLTLSKEQREVIVLAYLGGRTYREVADELDVPEGTVKTRMRAGLTKLRGTLQERGNFYA